MTYNFIYASDAGLLILLVIAFYIGFYCERKTTSPAKTQADIEYEADKAYWRNRTLTDDEIAKLFYETFHLQYTLLEDGLKFARAILRKAQEK